MKSSPADRAAAIERLERPGRPGESWTIEHVEELLRAHGCRVTRPRTAVLRALIETGGTVDAATLAERAQHHEPDIHEATVYRTVNVLTEVGLASHVHAGHGPSLVRLAGQEQLVAVCQDCGGIVSVPGEAVARLVTDTHAHTGFVIEPGHFALEGVCAACAG